MNTTTNNSAVIVKNIIRYAAAAGNFIMKQLKRVAWQALFLSVGMFYIVGYIGSIMLTEICSGIRIEDIPTHSVWMVFRIFIVGIVALICRRAYYWVKESD